MQNSIENRSNMFNIILLNLKLVVTISIGNRMNMSAFRVMGTSDVLKVLGECNLRTFKTSRASSYDFLFITYSTKSLHRFISIETSVLHSMERFHSRDQQPHWITETKESICLK